MTYLRYDPLDSKLVADNPDVLFVYEVALSRENHPLSKYPNTIGFPVKYYDHFGIDTHFSDRSIEFDIIKFAFESLKFNAAKFKFVRFPYKMIGSDITDWKTYSPKIFKYASECFDSQYSLR